jgi:hypothetical protein
MRCEILKEEGSCQISVNKSGIGKIFEFINWILSG